MVVSGTRRLQPDAPEESVELVDISGDGNPGCYLSGYPIEVQNHAGVLFGDSVVAACGGSNSDFHEECFQLDLGRNEWSEFRYLPEPRCLYF